MATTDQTTPGVIPYVLAQLGFLPFSIVGPRHLRPHRPALAFRRRQKRRESKRYEVLRASDFLPRRDALARE